jgi:hypothetical protein
MKVWQLSEPPSPDLARALAEFEAPFTYPLGPGKSFRISHGNDYTLFFRAQGNGSCFIAEDGGRVLGVLGTSVRRLWLPNAEEISAAYFGDLKIAPQARGRLVLGRLAREAEAWLRPKVAAGFGVVMGGTTMAPDDYTGRAGIPGFHDVGQVALLRVSGCNAAEPPGHFLTDRETGLGYYRQLSFGRYACPTGEAAARSRILPLWLVHPGGAACGLLEDTRKAKRLILEDGSELLSAHLSCFAYSSVGAAAELIEVALAAAVQAGLPALFVSVTASEAEELCTTLRKLEVHVASATVYGAGLAAGGWNINSSEI